MIVKRIYDRVMREAIDIEHLERIVWEEFRSRIILAAIAWIASLAITAIVTLLVT